MRTTTPLSAVVRLRRRHVRLTQTRLARAAGLTARYVSLIETDRRMDEVLGYAPTIQTG